MGWQGIRAGEGKNFGPSPVGLNNMSQSILIPASHVEKVLKRLGKIAKSAGITIEHIAGSTTLQDEDGRTMICARYTVGEMPKLAGFAFVARIQHQDGGNIVARAPFEAHDLDVKYRTITNTCSHCNKSRGRKETFILRTPEGELIQIGRNCLADFLMVSPTQIVAAAEFVHAVEGMRDDEESWGSNGGWDCLPLKFLASAISSIEHDGFIKAGEGGIDNPPTKESAAFIAGPKPWHPISAAVWSKRQPTDAHKAKAALVLEWCQAINANTQSEYLWNLRIASMQKGVGKNGGLLASAPSSFDRELSKKAEVKATGITSGFVQKEGEVWTGPAVLVRRNVIESQYGATAICTFRTDDGHEVVWFASGKSPTEIGKRYDMKGRVKRCENRKGVDQTIIASASFKEMA